MAWVAAASLLGFITAFAGYASLSSALAAKRQRSTMLDGLRARSDASGAFLESKGWAAFLVVAMAKASLPQSEGILGRLEDVSLWVPDGKAIRSRLRVAGLQESVSPKGLGRVRCRCAIGFCAAFGVVGLALSGELAAMGSLAGFVIGWHAPVSAVGVERRERSLAMEKQLSRLMEVLVLGLKCGMSFDRSLSLYTERFSGGLSAAFASAQLQWEHALVTRNEGLRAVAESYGSPVLDRLVESIVRAQRFGTSLTDVLVMQETEVRAVRKAALEERIAKAPVKMLVPVAALILPAMLLLVLGPVALNLMGGFG